MKRIIKNATSLRVGIAALAILVGGPTLLPYVPAITLFLETMVGN